MKKLVSIFLTLAMLLSLATIAFAVENKNLIISASEGRTYVGYRLLNVAASLKLGEHTGCDGAAHKETCYTYVYTVDEKYRDILKAEVAENDGRDTTTAGTVTDAQILDYLAAQVATDDSEPLRAVADRIYRAIKAAGKSADAEDLTGAKNTIEQGYWLFADVTDLGNQNKANSLVMVNTKGLTELTIAPKTDLPTLVKKVEDVNDSDTTDEDLNGWFDSADHDIGDTVSFKLTATLPDNVSSYDSYKMVFHDTLSDGLTLDAASIKVYMGDIDVTNPFTKTTSGLTDGCTFEVSCENILDIEGVTADSIFEVYYEAVLGGEHVVIGTPGNPNTAYLEFSNDPYSNGTGKTTPDKVTVFTYKLVINKTDGTNRLPGAGFTLYKKNAAATAADDDDYVKVGEELGGVDSAMTEFVWTGLDDGDYKLEETTVPAGYNGIAPIEFTISATHDETSDDPALTVLSGGNIGTGEVSTGAISKEIENNTGTILPSTGAEGTMMLIGGGTMLTLMAAVFMITRKKMSVYED